MLKRIFDVAGLLLTVIALAMAVKQYYDSRELTKELKVQRDEMGQISSLISTQPVGTFPANMDAVVKLVSESNKDLKIMADVAGYGHFSAPEKFEQYLQKLIDKKRAGQKVTIIVYGDSAYREDTSAQLKPADFQNLLQEKNKLRKYFEVFHPDYGVMPKDHASFLEALARYESENRTRMIKSGLELRVVPQIHDLPFFLWLKDDHEALFSFYNLGDNVREVTFKTTDGNLIAAFNDVFRQVYPISKKPSPTDPLASESSTDPGAAPKVQKVAAHSQHSTATSRK